MAFTHGVYKSEVPTSIIAPVSGEAGLPVVIGTAPIFMGEKSNVNKPVLCYSYADAVSALGYSEDWEKYTLCEFMYSQFSLFGQSPAVLINVFDPDKHSEKISEKEFDVVDGSVNLGPNVILSKGVTFDLVAESTALYDDDGNLIVSFEGNITASSVKATYYEAKPELVTESDIVGGYDTGTGSYKGLELVSRVFPLFRLVPGIIAAPKWSEKPGVAAVMAAKCEDINGLFSCVCVVDIPSSALGARVYSDVPNWKTRNNFVDSRMIVCWPKVKLGDRVFHMSTQMIGLMNSTDSAHDDVPYKSPSNELLQMDACVNALGEEVNLGLEEANYLNSQGVITPLNFMSGWVAWGNRTGTYPSNTDPKDCFIPVRRMFDYVGNTFIQTFWQRTDAPITRRLIQTIMNTFNVYLNGLAAREMILGGRIEFHEDENPVTSLIDGKLIFHVFLTPPIPAETIEAIFEYDPQYLSDLFAA